MSALTDELGSGVGDVLDALPLCDDQPPGVTMRITDHIDPPDHVEPIHNRAPVLVPAFPAALRVGLPVIHVDGPAVVTLCEGSQVVVVLTAGRVLGAVVYADRIRVVYGALTLDLRDPSVRDAVVRALWRKLRPGEPEPLTAPRWSYDGMGCWWLDNGEDGIPCDQNNRPTLANLPASPDRDLLALAAVCVAVLGAS